MEPRGVQKPGLKQWWRKKCLNTVVSGGEKKEPEEAGLSEVASQEPEVPPASMAAPIGPCGSGSEKLAHVDPRKRSGRSARDPYTQTTKLSNTIMREGVQRTLLPAPTRGLRQGNVGRPAVNHNKKRHFDNYIWGPDTSPSADVRGTPVFPLRHGQQKKQGNLQRDDPRL